MTCVICSQVITKNFFVEPAVPAPLEMLAVGAPSSVTNNVYYTLLTP